jgi:hypothetical protein
VLATRDVCDFDADVVFDAVETDGAVCVWRRGGVAVAEEVGVVGEEVGGSGGVVGDAGEAGAARHFGMGRGCGRVVMVCVRGRRFWVLVVGVVAMS